MTQCGDCGDLPRKITKWSEHDKRWVTSIICERCGLIATGKADTESDSVLKAVARWEDRL